MFSVSDEMHAGSIIHAYAGRDENTQVNGYVFLVDWTGFTAKQLTRWNMDDMRKWNSCWQVLFNPTIQSKFTNMIIARFRESGYLVREIEVFIKDKTKVKSRVS